MKEVFAIVLEHPALPPLCIDGNSSDECWGEFHPCNGLCVVCYTMLGRSQVSVMSE